MGTTQKLVAVVLVAAASFGIGFCTNDNSRTLEDAKVREDSLKKRVLQAENMVAQVYAIDAARKDTIRKLQDTLRYHKLADVKLVVDGERLKRQIKQQLNDSAFRVVEPLIANYDARLEAMAIQNRTLQEIVSVQGNQLMARDTLIHALRRLNKDLEREVGRLNGDLRKVNRNGNLKLAGAAAIVVGALIITK